MRDGHVLQKTWEIAHRKYTHTTTKQIKLQAKQHQILYK